ncbi:MAG: class I SAM-dependent methyltransferase [Nocardioidaceae bacterium]
MTAPEAGDAARGLFGDAAEDYDRLRLAPSTDALEWMMSGRERVVLDLAAGTGQISRQLDRPGLDVVAVEPDEQMRAVLGRRCPHARVLSGVAEDIPVEEASIDTVLVGTAWHWFDTGRALAEVARILRPGGRLAAVGTIPDPYVGWVEELIDPAEADHLRANMQATYIDVALPSAAFTAVETHEVASSVRMPAEDARAYFATRSGYLIADAQEKARLDNITRRGLAARFPSAQQIELPQRSWCWRTQKTAL